MTVGDTQSLRKPEIMSYRKYMYEQHCLKYKTKRYHAAESPKEISTAGMGAAKHSIKAAVLCITVCTDRQQHS